MFRTNAKRILSLFLVVTLMSFAFTRSVYSAPLDVSGDEDALSSLLPSVEDEASMDDVIIDNIPLDPDYVEGTDGGDPKRPDEDPAISMDDITFVEPDKQILSTATLDDEFADDTVTVILTKEASRNNQDFTVNDFRDVGVAEIEDLVRLSDRECRYVEQVWATQDFVGTMMKREKQDKNAAEGHISFETYEAIRQYEDTRQIAEENTLVNVDEFRRILLIRLAKPGKANVLQAIRQLEQREDIRYAGPNYITKESVLESMTPNDPGLGDQWPIDRISLPGAWDVTTGSASINVGVIDTGIDGSHEDLRNRVNPVLSRDFVGDGLSPDGLTDPQGHGTNVAGIIGAQGNNHIGIAGVNWDVRLVSLRVLNRRGVYGSPLGCNVVAVAVNYARENSIPILNASLNIGMNDQDNQFIRAAVAGYNGLFVQCAGNDYYYPTSNQRFEGFPNVIVVASTDRNDELSSFSEWGLTSVHLAAPGGVNSHGADDILSTYPADSCQNGSCGGRGSGHFANGYHYNAGTSMAAPYVAGVAALIWSAFPSIELSRLREAILNSVDKVPALSTKVSTGGRLNAYKALTYLYGVTYDANAGNDLIGGTLPTDGYGYFSGETAHVKSETPTRVGYRFMGWTMNAEGTGTLYNYSTLGLYYGSFNMPDSNVTLYAKWEYVGNPMPLPNITEIKPSNGIAGTKIKITGTNFNYLQQVKVGGVACYDLEIISATSATCYVPDLGAYVSGTKALALTNINGNTNSVTPTFTYNPAGTFKFTIDTRMLDKLDTDSTRYNGTATTFAIPTSGFVDGYSNAYYDWTINWGDGTALQTVSGTSSANSAGISHTYAARGEYQITISPTVGYETSGWLDAFGFYSNTSGANVQTNKNMFKSIDSMLTDMMRSSGYYYSASTHRFAFMFYGARNAVEMPYSMFRLVNIGNVMNMLKMFDSTFSYYAYNSTTATIPSGLFYNVTAMHSAQMPGVFANTFSYYAYNSTVGTIPAGLFSSINASAAISTSNMFDSTFRGYAYNSTVGTIPSGLFPVIASIGNASDMFSCTFYTYAYKSTVGTIPPGLFNSINATGITDAASMFRSTFYYYAYNSTVGTIPSGLFSTINPSTATNASFMFYSTFDRYAYNSTVGTIPSGLFSTINVSNAHDVSYMFCYVFYYYARASTVATIPPGLFSNISFDSGGAYNIGAYNMFSYAFAYYAYNNTTATIPSNLFGNMNFMFSTVTGMFQYTFSYCAYNSTVGTIPNGIFNNISLYYVNTSSLSGLFNNTFSYYSYANKSPTTNVNNVFPYISWFYGTASSSNLGGTNGVFYRTFYNMPSLIGSAQTFINNIADGSTPGSSAQAFTGTSVTDLGSIDPNWR